MCPYESTSKTLEQGRMEWGLFCKIIDDLISYPSLQHISLMLQNEPTLNKNLPNEIKYVKSKRPDIITSITTNGSLLTKDFVSQLADSGLNSIIFSLNGLTKKIFNSVQKKLDYDIVVSNLYSLIENKPSNLSVIVKSMIIKNNAIEFGFPDKFSQLPKFLKKHNIPLDISPISNRAGSLTNYDEVLVFEHLQSSKKKTICNDAFNRINILFNGDVIVCCADWNRKSVFGNLKNLSIQEVWTSPEALQRRQFIKEGRYNELEPCRTCSQAKNIMSNLHDAK